MVSGRPWIGVSKMYAHSDLVRGPPYYMLADTICGVLPGFRASVYELNYTCGNAATLAAFNNLIVRHENNHQESLNECVRSANSGRLAVIEELTGTREGVARNLEEKWTKGLATGLVRAGKTAQRNQRSGLIWEFRGQGAWKYRTVKAKDHNGQRGC